MEAFFLIPIAAPGSASLKNCREVGVGIEPAPAFSIGLARQPVGAGFGGQLRPSCIPDAHHVGLRQIGEIHLAQEFNRAPAPLLMILMLDPGDINERHALL